MISAGTHISGHYNLFFRTRERGQSTVEFTALLIVIILGFIAMQVYLKRAHQGRLRAAADENIGSQYSPSNTTSDIILRHTSRVNTTVYTVVSGGRNLTTTVVNTPFDTTIRSGSEIVR